MKGEARGERERWFLTQCIITYPIGGLMISLLVLIGLLFSSSVALSSDMGLVCVIDMGSNSFKLILGERAITFNITLQKTD